MRERIETGRSEAVPVAEALLRELEPALKGHLQVSKQLKGQVNLQLARTYADIKAQMSRLVYRGFITDAGEWLRHYPRYMEAALIRLEKAPREIRRDQLAMDEINGFEQRLANRQARALQQGVPDAELVDFGWWIEELRVSLFAQQLGTLEPVSQKRLDRRWKEITEGQT